MYIKKSKFLFFQSKEGASIDVAKLLNGIGSLIEIKQLVVYSVVAQDSFVLTKEEFELLSEVSSAKWECSKTYSSLTRERIIDFAGKGILLIKDSKEQPEAKYEKNESALIDSNWNELSAFYHFSTKWNRINLQFKIDAEKIRANNDTKSVIGHYIAKKGFPPDHFYHYSPSLATIKLPRERQTDDFFQTLTKRKTTRLFDTEKLLPLRRLSCLLYYTFGCHGISSVYKNENGEAFALKKTSPSGGGLHPTEAYVLINRVEGLSAGIYHYDVQHHALQLIKHLEIAEIKELANDFTAGQDYPSNANVTVVLTSRYFRNYWKYDQHPHAYKVLLMDAAHLSQTFYLTCTHMGLGAFTTAAINARYIEKELKLDEFQEGALLVVGCGYPIDIDLVPDFDPYTPFNEDI